MTESLESPQDTGASGRSQWPAVRTITLGDLLEVFYPILPPIYVSPTSTSITTDWDVHCLEASTHNLHWDNEVLLPEFWVDPDPANNSPVPGAGELDLSVDCLAEADLKILDQVASAAPAAKSPLPAPTLITEVADTFEITKVVHNNGGLVPRCDYHASLIRWLTLQIPDRCPVDPHAGQPGHSHLGLN